MPLLGQAALLLTFDVVQEAITEHDDWHTHEHLPERLSIPGFLRGTRWVAVQGQPRYFVLYEVEHLATLSSPAYLERLHNPTPWTTKMMPGYRGMHRGLCAVAGSAGSGSGHLGLLTRFKPAEGSEGRLAAWIRDAVLARLPARRGLGSAHWLRGAAPPAMTTEQSLRGADAGVDWALLATGYDADAVAALMQADLGLEQLTAEGAIDVVSALYRMDYAVANDAAKAPAPARKPAVTMSPVVQAFWEGFEAARGGSQRARLYEVFHFADSEATADGLAELVLRGTKRATAGLVWSFEAAGQGLLQAGDLSIVTDWAGTPVCIVETIAVDVVPYEDVSAEFAAVEGEGDGSLDYWREAHWAYFGRECARLGRQPSPEMPVACERFEVVYRA